MSDLARTIADLTPEQRALLELRLRKRRETRSARPPAIGRCAAGTPAQLSFAQRRLWLLDQLEPGSPLYLMPSVLRLDGKLRVPALARSLDTVLARHEVLRAAFAEVEGEPVVAVAPALDLPTPVVDLSGLPEPVRQDEGRRLAAGEARRAFDLSRPPLLRSTLLRMAEARHLWLLTLHHVVADGWSVGVLVRELVAGYAAFSSGHAPALPELPIQYADFAAWQRERLAGELLDRQLAYWRRRLADLPRLELPADRPRPAMRSFRGAVVHWRLAAPPLAALLATFAGGEGATLFMTLLAGFAALLGRYAGQVDVAVGTPVANRDQLEIEGLIGFFVNTLVLRTDLGAAPTFRQLLRRVREATVDDFAHQDVPFERLVEELRPDRDLLRSPLFDVLFALQNAPRPALAAPGLTVTLLEGGSGTAKFDLGLFLAEDGGGIAGACELSTDLFDATRGGRLGEHLGNLLAAAVGEPDRALAEFLLLSAAERQQLLLEWNDSGGRRGEGLCLHDLFARQARRTPDAPAVVVAGVAGVAAEEALSYRALDRRSNRLAHHLRTLGIGAERPVGLLLERSPAMLVGLLGILKAGAPYVPLDPYYPVERLAVMASEARLAALVTREGLLPLLALPGCPRVRLDADAAALAAYDAEAPPAAAAVPENLAYVIFTSGSTGRPKGVALSHGVLVSLMLWQEAAGLPGRARTALLTPLGFDVHCQEIFSTLGAGGTLVLVDDETRRDPVLLLDLLARAGVERLFLPFVALQQLAATAAEGEEVLPTALREVVTAGEQLQVGAALVRLFEALPDCRLHNQYGPSETHVVTAFTLAGPPARWPRLPPIGRPVSGARIHLLDTTLLPVPVGVVGELYIGGQVLARGYAGRPELTAERFGPDGVGGGRGDHLYRTGDLARWDASGNLEFVGRADGQLKVRGFRVEPAEIEALLSGHPEVRQAAVVASAACPAERALLAYVVPRETGRPLPNLRAFLRRQLPDYMVPAAVVTLAELPLTPSGKLDRRRLPAPPPAAAAAPGAAAGPAADAVEEILAGLWAELLGRAPSVPSDDFFALGGHSLAAVRLVARLRSVFAVRLPLRAVFAAPTLAALAGEIRRARGGSAVAAAPVRALLPAEREAPLPLSFVQERLWFLAQLAGGEEAYNLPSALLLGGALDPAALRASLGELVRRHEALRTVYSIQEGRLVQVIGAPGGDPPLPLVDLARLPVGGHEQEARRLACRLAGRPFDLVQGPLLRAALLRLDAGHPARDHVLLLDVHHIAVDGWSFGILLSELSELLAASAAGRPAALAPPPLQYADYAVWQRAALTEPLAAQLAWWREQLAGSPPLLELPTDRPRPSQQTFHGGTRSLALSGDLAGELARLARREGATPFMMLLAAFGALLARITGRADLVVGTPVAGRGAVELEAVVGCFINTLALRLDLAGDPSFLAALARTRATALAAYDHQDVPFALVVDAVVRERDLSASPLFQVHLSLQDAFVPPRRLGELAVAPFELPARTARFDLSLAIDPIAPAGPAAPAAGGLHAALSFNRDLFDATTAERLLGCWHFLLGAALAAPERRLSELPLLTAAERAQLAVESNDTARELVPPLLVHRLFEAQARRTPEAPAVFWRDAALSYRELAERAWRLACLLRGLGVGPDVVVGVCLERSPTLLWALVGVLAAGGAYLPLDPGYPEERLALVAADAGAVVVLTERALRGRLPISGAVVLALDDGETAAALARQSAMPPPPPDAEPESLAYVIHTSGSTGRPKGVMVSHRNVVNFFAGMDERIGGAPGTWLAITSIAFDISVAELLWTLARGFRVVLPAGDLRQVALAAASGPARTPAERSLDFSLFYFACDEAESERDKYRLLLEGARFADAHGFAAVWTPERHFHAFGGLYPNPAVVGAAVAAVTTRIAVRAGSVVLPLQDPLRVAEEWSVVDNLSHGRAGVSFASGWHAEDFALAPHNYARRKEVLLRDLATVRRLWRGEAITREGGGGRPVEVRIRPRPVQAELPFWLTAAGNPETFELAGEAGGGVLTHLLGQSLESLAGKIARYRAAWRRAGHAGDGQVTLMLHAFVGTDEEEVKRIVRRPFREYLRSSVDLMANLARAVGKADLAHLSAEDIEALLDHAFERYFGDSALFGTPEQCSALAERCAEIGVDEIACLIDFGVPVEAALAALSGLDAVRRASQEARPAPSLPAREPSLAAPSAAAAGEALPDLLARHAVTHLQCTPAFASLLAPGNGVPTCIAGLRRLLVGGEAFPPSLAERLGALPGEVHNMYGPTETTVWSASDRLGGAPRDGCGRVPVGRPLANTSLHLLDAELQPLPHGVPGELYIGGEGVTRGYLGRPQETAAAFLPDPFSRRPGARFYRTGDLARVLPDGRLDVLGRRDSQVKVRGYRIELGEIETRLAGHPRVRQTAVVVAGGDGQERRLIAYVAAAGGDAPLDPEAVRAALDGRDSYTLPNGMVVASLSHLQTSQLYREIFELERYLQHGVTLEDGDAVFDVGANIGFFTLWASRKRRGLRIFAFEPIPPTYDYLCANARLHGLDAVLVNAGLAARRESADLTFYRALPGLSGRYAELEADRAATRAIVLDGLREQAATVGAALSAAEIEEALDEHFRSEIHRCELRTLSEVIAEHSVDHIDLLKIDVERSELDVLAGLDEADWPKVRQIVLEVDGRGRLAAIAELLNRRGFAATVETLVEVPATATTPEVFIAMVYAIRRGAARPPATVASDDLASELRAYLAAALPDYMVPPSFVFLPSLPTTPNGKVDRRALLVPPSAAVAARGAAAYQPPESATEQAVAAIWREALHLERAGVHDNFFEVGGNSLLMAQVLVRLRETFYREVPIVDLFRHTTIRSLARYLDGEADGDGKLEQAAGRGRKLVASVQGGEATQRRRQFRAERRGGRGDVSGAGPEVAR